MTDIDDLIERLNRHIEAVGYDQDSLIRQAADALAWAHKQAMTNEQSVELLMEEIANLWEALEKIEDYRYGPTSEIARAALWGRSNDA